MEILNTKVLTICKIAKHILQNLRYCLCCRSKYQVPLWWQKSVKHLFGFDLHLYTSSDYWGSIFIVNATFDYSGRNIFHLTNFTPPRTYTPGRKRSDGLQRRPLISYTCGCCRRKLSTIFIPVTTLVCSSYRVTGR